MKHKVGDTVRIKSREWWDAQPKYCGGSVQCGADIFVKNMADTYCGTTAKILNCNDIEYSL